MIAKRFYISYALTFFWQFFSNPCVKMDSNNQLSKHFLFIDYITSSHSHHCSCKLTRNVLVLVLLEMAIEVGLLTKAAVAQVTLEGFLLVMDIADMALKIGWDAEWTVTVFTPDEEEQGYLNVSWKCSRVRRALKMYYLSAELSKKPLKALVICLKVFTLFFLCSFTERDVLNKVKVWKIAMTKGNMSTTVFQKLSRLSELKIERNTCRAVPLCVSANVWWDLLSEGRFSHST